MQNLCFMPECNIWCTEVGEMVLHQMHPFYSTGPKMTFGCVLEHLENLWRVKRCKTCVWCTEVAKMVSHLWDMATHGSPPARVPEAPDKWTRPARNPVDLQVGP
jgi:hypothetical protein